MSNSEPNRLNNPIYHSYRELVEDLNQLRALDGSGFVDSSVTSIGQSPDGQWQILALKIGRNPAHRVLILGGAHAREWIAVEVPYLLAKLLVKVANDLPVDSYYDRYKDKIQRLAIRVISLNLQRAQEEVQNELAQRAGRTIARNSSVFLQAFRPTHCHKRFKGYKND